MNERQKEIIKALLLYALAHDLHENVNKLFGTEDGLVVNGDPPIDPIEKEEWEDLVKEFTV